MATTETDKPKRTRTRKPKVEGVVVDGDICLACKQKKGKPHEEGCPNGTCPECEQRYTLGHAETCSKHPANNKAPVLNGKTGEVLESATDDDDEDDEHQHDHEHAHEGAAQAPIDPYPTIMVEDAWVAALQAMFDNGDFSGAVQKQTKCGFQSIIDGKLIRCPHVAVLKKVITEECPTCERKGKTTTGELCIGHGIQVWGAGAPMNAQIPMGFTK